VFGKCVLGSGIKAFVTQNGHFLLTFIPCEFRVGYTFLNCPFYPGFEVEKITAGTGAARLSVADLILCITVSILFCNYLRKEVVMCSQGSQGSAGMPYWPIPSHFEHCFCPNTH